VSDLEIRDLDRGSDAQVRAYWEVGRDSVADRPYNTHQAWRAASTYLRAERTDMVDVRLTAWRDGQMVGAAGLLAPVHENTDTAFVDMAVVPGHWRTGVGSALLVTLEQRARALGRRVLLADVCAPPDAESPATMFAARHGFHVELEDGMKVVDLVATRASWSALAEEVAPHHGDYRLVTTWAPVPDDLMDGYCGLNTAFNTEAPSGQSELENERWDAERVREREARAAKAGRRDAYTFALDTHGEVVALTELFVNETMPHRAFQSGTLVLPGHRGHRLGMAIKLANHQALVERFPQVEWMLTGNADVNAPMNAVNEALGYRVVERALELRKEL
jgi:GNAT superfamily N-acetyltransferase